MKLIFCRNELVAWVSCLPSNPLEIERELWFSTVAPSLRYYSAALLCHLSC